MDTDPPSIQKTAKTRYNVMHACCKDFVVLQMDCDVRACVELVSGESCGTGMFDCSTKIMYSSVASWQGELPMIRVSESVA